MLNQIILVGRLVRDPELKEMEGGRHLSYITLAVPRNFKNRDGEYETDFIECTLWEQTARNTVEYCKRGNIVGVKGRVQSRTIGKEEKERRTVLEVIAEKVTFLSMNSREEVVKN